MRVVVYGAGYVGLVASACYGDLGHDVDCIDIIPERIADLSQGNVRIYEPELQQLVRKGLERKKLSFCLKNSENISISDAIVVCVGTASRANDTVDVSTVRKVVNDIATDLKGGAVIYIKSTVPPGTVDSLQRLVNSKRKDLEPVTVAANPEFLAQGSAVRDFHEVDRIVIGTDNPQIYNEARTLYGVDSPTSADIQFVLPASAELMKYSANLFLSLRVAFINEVSKVAEYVGADVVEVKEGIGRDPRIGQTHLNPGLGFGGSCLPKDLSGFVRLAEAVTPKTWVSSLEKANNLQPKLMYDKLVNRYGSLYGHTFSMLGLAFKPGTSDTRKSPAIELAKMLIEDGASVHAYDPYVSEVDEVPEIDCVDSIERALDKSTCLIAAVAWPEFKELDLDKVARALSDKVIFDCCNMFNPKDVRERSLSWIGVGRPSELL